MQRFSRFAHRFSTLSVVVCDHPVPVPDTGARDPRGPLPRTMRYRARAGEIKESHERADS